MSDNKCVKHKPDMAKKEETPSVSLLIMEKKLKRLEEVIERYSKSELSLDDMNDENNDYLKQQSLINQYMDLWKEYRKMTSKSDGRSKMYKKLTITRSKFNEVNEGLRKYLIAKKRFPDYQEIEAVVIKVNEDNNLKMTQSCIKYESLELFYEVGTQLQKKRKHSLAANMQLLVEKSGIDKLQQDPGDTDPVLKKHLMESRNSYDHKLEQVFRQYTEQSMDETSDGNETKTSNDSSESEEDQLVLSPIPMEDIDE